MEEQNTNITYSYTICRRPMTIPPIDLSEYEPLVTEPLVTEPLVIEPLVTEPLVTQPLVTQPLVIEPQVIIEEKKKRFFKNL